MTDPRPEAIETASVQSPGVAPRPRRRLVWLVVAVILVGLAGRWMYVRVNERPRVVAAIEAAGGKYNRPTSRPFLDRLFDRLSGQREVRDTVFLDGPKFDDEWLAAQHDLRSLEVSELMIRDTRLSRTAILRLVEQHSLNYLGAPGVDFTDADAEVLARHKRLTSLFLMQSELTDAGLAALRPQRLEVLSIAGTRVTSAALQRELAGAQRLQYLCVDGIQFAPELAAQLAQLKTLNMISLIGPDVTDGHVKLLESMPNLRYIRLEETSVSEAAAAALRAARPAPVSIEVAPPAEVFFKWRTE